MSKSKTFDIDRDVIDKITGEIQGSLKNNLFMSNRDQSIDDVVRALDDLDPENAYRVTIEQFHGNRSLIKNRQMWAINNRVSKSSGHSVKFIHGLSKMDILLPYMFELEKHRTRAEFIRDILGQVVAFEGKVFVAYDLIRSRDLAPDEFDVYVARLIQHWSNTGDYTEIQKETKVRPMRQ